MSVIDETKTKMNAAVDFVKKELKNLRTNRANASILDSVTVEVYGTSMKIRDLANVTVPEARQLLITPFDPQTSAPISKSIEKANLGLQPVLDGNTVRITIPPMDEATRKEIVKLAKKKAEEGKVAIRDVRRKQNEIVRKLKTDSGITEDEMKSQEKQIQELTDQFCKEIDGLSAAKEKDILEV